MPEQILKNVGIWIDGRNLAGVSNAVGITLEADAPESTSFADEWRSRAEGGLKTSGLSLEGWYDRGDIDAAQFSSIGNDGSALIAPAGQTRGALAYVIPYTASAFEPGASVGELMAFTFAGEGDGEPVRGQVLDISEGVTADTETPHLEIGAVAADQRVYVWCHVRRVSGTVRIRLRSKATAGGNTTNRIDLGSITNTGIYAASLAGPITHRFWELHYDIQGTSDFDIAAAVAIE